MIIPKEIQALERLKNTLLAEGYWQDVLEDVSIIENALNQYYKLLKEDDETTKKLKALEIIKEHTLYCENVDCFVFVNVTKEVNDLLKEVLL